MKKRGLSQVISAVLLVLLIIIAIFAIYGISNYFEKKAKDEIILEPILINLDITSAYINKNNDTAIIGVSRTGAGEIKKLKFIFEEKNGMSYVYDYQNPKGFPKESEIRIYEIKARDVDGLIDFSKIVSVSIAFTVLTESSEELTSIVKDTFGKTASENIRDIKNNLTVNTPTSGSSGSSGGTTPGCTAQCAGKTCGADGCGGICGTCLLSQFCNPSGQCIYRGRLVAYYAFEGNSNDLSGYNNHGTVYGANLTLGKIQSGYSFDGINDYIEAIDSESISLKNAITISAWIKDSGTIGHEVIIAKDNEYMMKINQESEGGTVACFVYLNDNWEPRVIGAKIPENEWNHVACTFDNSSGNLEIYINGKLNSTRTGRTGNINSTTNPLNIGKRGTYFNGTIDEVKIWDYSLSDLEILQEYERTECIRQCAGKECGPDICGGTCAPGCQAGENCQNGICTSLISNNLKDMSKYSSKESFLISDSDWKEVLPYVPLTVWTGGENCQKGYGTSDGVCAYPMLIYHGEDDYNLPNTYSNDFSSSVYSVNGVSLVRIYLDKYSIQEFLKKDLDIASVGDDHLDIVLSDNERRFFEERGYNLEILPITLPKFASQGTYDLETGYHTYDSMTAELNNIEDNYPSIAKVYDIGKSVQGRSIYAIKISDNVATKENEQRILVTGNHHAREIITVEIPLYMINYFVNNYESDIGIKNIVDNHELWFIPMVNPDGHVIVENGNLMWRKNARDNNNDGDVEYGDGVDLNRNYGYSWGYNNRGSSPNPTSEAYRGISAFSEPETMAIFNLSIQNNFSYVIDYHSYAGAILYPWGHLDTPTPDDSLFRSLANDFKRYLKGYDSGRIPEIVGDSNGDSITWHYGDQTNKSKTIAFGIEVDTTSFISPASEIVPISRKQLMVLLNLTGYNIPYQEDANIDIDSIIYFMQQYSPDRLTLLGNSNQEIDNLLVASRPVGAGLDTSKIQRINIDNYLSYWARYDDIVYVEDNYELALIASTYASLINAPLIIEGNSLDKPENFNGKSVICIGNVNLAAPNNCIENYNLESLQQKYFELTKTKKAVLVNPDDLNIDVLGNLDTEKTNSISNLYSKNSLIAPILASSKHELILTNISDDYASYDSFIEEKFSRYYNENITLCKYSETCASGFNATYTNMPGVNKKITFYIKGFADITPYDLDPYRGNVNEEIPITISVKNIGFNVSKDCSVELYLLNNTGETVPGGGGGSGGGFGGGGGGSGPVNENLIFIGRQNIGDINEDEIKEAIINWTPTEVGYNNLYVNVSTISEELNKGNNINSYTFYITGPSPDLKVSSEKPLVMRINSVNYINISVSNIGLASSGAFNLSLELSNGTLIGTTRILSLNPGESQTARYGFTPTEETWYEFSASAYLQNDLDINNNYDYFGIRSTNNPIDVNQNIEVFPYNELGIVNELNKLNFSVWNYGYETLNNGKIDLYIRSPTQQDFVLKETKNIGDITTYRKTFTFDWVPDEIGSYNFIFNTTYYYNNVKYFNDFWYNINSNINGPDLSGWFYVEDIELGNTGLFQVNVRNQGSRTANNVNFTLYDNNVKFYDYSVGSIGSGLGKDIEVNWNPSEIGMHEIKLVIRGLDDIDLSNNNQTSDVWVYEKANVDVDIKNYNGNYIPRYVSIFPHHSGSNKLDYVNGRTTLSVPNLTSNIQVFNSSSVPDESIEFSLFSFSNLNLSSFIGIISENYRGARTIGNIRLYDINANLGLFNYEQANALFNYPDYRALGINDPSNLMIYYCTSWNFNTRDCSSGWDSAPYFKESNGYYLRLEGWIYGKIQAFAVGEYIDGTYNQPVENPNKFDIEKLKINYENSKYNQQFSDFGSSNFQISIPGFFYNCTGDEVMVNIDFNNQDMGTTSVNCYNNLPKIPVIEYLNSYTFESLRNITLSFNSDLIFYDTNKMLLLRKDYNNEITFSESDSSGTIRIPVAIFGALGDSRFNFENKNYTSIIIMGEASSNNKTDLDIYLNDQLIGVLDLNNSNGDKGREFKIPENLRTDTNLIVSVKPKEYNKLYLASVKLKTDFDPYYLTIIGNPDAIPNEDENQYESDFRHLGDIDDDKQAEYSVGRIMGLSSSDTSAYLARVLFYDKIPKKKGATFTVEGDGYDQGIPVNTCGKSFCRCYWDIECPEIFDRYRGYFSPFETCSQDLINGIPQAEGTSDCENETRLLNNILYNSSMTVYGGHAGYYGFGSILRTHDLVDLPPEFNYVFGCQSCSFRIASNENPDELLCANMIRRGSIGYQGSVENMYGNHFLNEIFDGILINNESIGYAFKTAKNKEVRFDWQTPNLPEVVTGSYDIRKSYGVHDTLIGDPTFTGGFGI